MNILTINKEGTLDIVNGGDVLATITSIEEYNNNEVEIDYCSSSIDFPNEYTEDSEILHICREIRYIDCQVD